MRAAVLLFTALLVPALASAQSETIEYYGQDAVGSVRIVFDVSGTVLGRQDYAPFGRVLMPSFGMPAEGFVGNTTDGESDQGYFHARQYQTRTGRFGQVDPIYKGLFQPQGWNRYAYAVGSPLVYVDSMGLDCPPVDAYNFCVNVTGSTDPVAGFYSGFWQFPVNGELPTNFETRINQKGKLATGKQTKTDPPTTPPTDDPKDGPKDPPKDPPHCGGNSDNSRVISVSSGGSLALFMGPDYSSGIYYVPGTGEWGFAFNQGFVIGLGYGFGLSFGTNGLFSDFKGESITLSAGVGPVGGSRTKDAQNQRWTGTYGTFAPAGSVFGATVGRETTTVVPMGHVCIE